MSPAVIAQFAIATMLPVAACVVLTLLRRRERVARISYMRWQVIVGVIFGLIAIYGTEVSIPVAGAAMNVRDAAPLVAGLCFGGPAGIIAGVIGGVERWLAVMWGVGEFTRVACSVATIFAGFYAAIVRRLVLDRRAPSWPFALAAGVVAEVLHLLLVFVTNFDQPARAFDVVQACALPMIGCVALSTTLCALVFALLEHRPMRVARDERSVAQIVQERLLVVVVVAFAITVGFTAALQTNLSNANTAELLRLNVIDVEQDVAGISGEDPSAQLETIVRNRHVGVTGEVVAIDAQGTAIGLDDSSLDIGQLVADARDAEPAEMFSTTFAGARCFASYQDVGGYRIIAMQPADEANHARDVSLLIVSFMEVLVFAALFLVIYFVIKHVVVNGVRRVNRRLDQITDGDLDVQVDVRGSTEFASLSDGINRTVGALKASNAAAQADLDMAAEVQMNVLPSLTKRITGHREFELFAGMKPARELGGDFYDFFFVDDDHLALVVADVSGKGVPAALFMMLAKAVVKMEALAGDALDEVLRRANATLTEKNDNDMFATVWLGVLQVSTGRLAYVDAGHEKLALRRNGVWELPPKPNGAVALGAFAQEDYADLPERYRFRTHVVELAPGDAVFQYTDGVTEATNASDEAFGEERLLAALTDAGDADPQGILPVVRDAVIAFADGAPQYDDITMLGLVYKGPDQGEPARDDETE